MGEDLGLEILDPESGKTYPGSGFKWPKRPRIPDPDLPTLMAWII
jgi:hypothetical protein